MVCMVFCVYGVNVGKSHGVDVGKTCVYGVNVGKSCVYGVNVGKSFRNKTSDSLIITSFQETTTLSCAEN